MSVLPLWQTQMDRIHFEEPVISQIDEKFPSFFGIDMYTFTGFHGKPSDQMNPVYFVKFLSLHLFLYFNLCWIISSYQQ